MMLLDENQTLLLFTQCIIDAANTTHAPVHFAKARAKIRGRLGDEQMLPVSGTYLSRG